MKNFNRFYIESKDALFAYLVRMTGDYHLSKDILQESFSRLLGHYSSETPNKALLFTIARNLLRDGRRKNYSDTELEENRVKSSGNPEKNLMIKESYSRVLAAMDQLDSAERDILALVASSGLTYRKISEILKISEANVKVKVHRARKKLKKCLQQEM